MDINLEELSSIYEQEKTIADAARKYCSENNIEYSDSIRRKCHAILNKNNVIKDNDTKDNNYKTKVVGQERVIFTALDSDGKMMSIEKYCEFYGLEYNKVKSYKLISHSGTPFYNIVFFEYIYTGNDFAEFSKTLLE